MAVFAVAASLLVHPSAWARKVSFNLPAQEASRSIAEFSRASGVQLLISQRHAEGRVTNAVVGELTAEQALSQLLDGTGLEARRTAANTWTILPRIAPAKRPAANEVAQEFTSVTDIPEILVQGIRYWSLNTGIPRTEADSQPYIVFEREQIERSGARTLEDFFRSFLGADTSVATSDSNFLQAGLGRINLRGLGSTETLILLDGRRLPGANNGAGFIGQANVAGIPLDSIERVEVLASSASSIYGANATGGVINIIRKRDYQGLDATIHYGDVANGSGAERALSLSGGWDLNGGSTQISFHLGTQDREPLLLGDRDYYQRYAAFALQNNPRYFAELSSPPMGSTTNIRSADGSPLVFDDGTPLGSHFTHIPEGYRGLASDGVGGLLDNAGTYNTRLGETSARGALTSLTNRTRGSSAAVAGRRQLGDSLTIYAEAAVSSDTWRALTSLLPFSYVIAGNAPNNPFRQSIRVTVPHGGADVPMETRYKTWRGLTGAIVQLPGGWETVGDLSWSRSRYSEETLSPPIDVATNQGIRDGTLDVMRDLRISPISYGYLTTVDNDYLLGPADAINRTASLRFAGPTHLDLGGGPAVATFLLERSETALQQARTVSSTTTSSTVSFMPSRSLTTKSAYMEFKAPIFSQRRPAGFARELELQVAARHDTYKGQGAAAKVSCRSTTSRTLPQEVIDQPCPEPGAVVPRAQVNASTTNPTYSMRWKPVDGVQVRASYATGFLPIYLHQVIKASTPAVFVNVTDPLRGGEPVGVRLGPGSQLRILTGPGNYARGNPDLEPERSTSYSAGLLLEPSSVPGLRIAADWTRIDKKDIYYDPNILLSGNNNGLNPGGQAMFEAIFLQRYPERVIRGPASDGYAVGPILAIDASMVNLLAARTESWDYGIDYEHEYPSGRLEASLRATYLKELSVQYAPGQPGRQLQGVVDDFFARGLAASGGVRKKATLSLLWTMPNWQIGWRVRYLDGYYVDADRSFVPNLGSSMVKSQAYNDLFLRRPLGENTDIRFSWNNVFDREPPIDNSGGAGYSRFADPRQSSYGLTLSHSF